MKLSSLLMSAGTATLLLFAPLTAPSADAAMVKVKVKVKAPSVIKRAAKIRVKPKIKLRAAKIAPKPKLKLKPVKLSNTPKIVQKAKVSPKVLAAAVAATGNTKQLAKAFKHATTNLPKAPDPGLSSNAPNVSVAPETSTRSALAGNAPATKPRNTPSLDVPGGFLDVFRVSGGNLNDALRNAADLESLQGSRSIWKDFWSGLETGDVPTGSGSGFGPQTRGSAGGGMFAAGLNGPQAERRGMPSNALPSGSDGFGRQRVGAGMDGPPMGAAGAPNDGGQASGDWQKQPSSGNGRQTQWQRDTDVGGESVGWQTYDVERNSDGSVTATLETFDHGSDNTGPDFVQTTHWTAPEKDGTRTMTITTVGADGETTEKQATVSSERPPSPTPTDQNGDGHADEAGTVPIANPQTEQPVSEGSSAEGTGGCGVWTPFGGCQGKGPKLWETISQPGTDEQGTVMVGGSARPNAGPAAVTNGGDGGFDASSGGGGSRGFGHDPCAVVKTPGCGSPGPDGPGPTGSGPSAS